MTIIHEEQLIDNTINKRFTGFIKRFKINNILRKINATKVKGVSAYHIFTFLLGLTFTRKNYFSLFTGWHDALSFKKDVVYRFLNRPHVRWEELVPEISEAVIPAIDRLTSEGRISVYIIDDTTYYRDRSKKVELLSWCRDHSLNRYYKGFTMLNLGWSDGVTYMPVDFRLVASGNDQNLLEGSHIKEDYRTLATKRRVQARTDKPALVLQMLERAKGAETQVRHVLLDSWFSAPKAILNIKVLGYDVVARLKDHKNYRYLYNGQYISLKQIYKQNRKRSGRSRYLLSVDVHVRHNDVSESVPAKIVYVRDRSNAKKWIAIISTDVALSEDEIIALYGKRWDIEPFHKVIKSTLKLTKEFQLRSFDSIFAHAAMVLIRYIFLSLENRENMDERSIGELFMSICDELDDISFQHAFELIVSLLDYCLCEYLFLSKKQIQSILDFFYAHLPGFIHARLLPVVCES